MNPITRKRQMHGSQSTHAWLPYICLLFSGFSNVYHSVCVWPTALKLGCVTNFDVLFLDEIQFMLISTCHICVRSIHMPFLSRLSPLFQSEATKICMWQNDILNTVSVHEMCQWAHGAHVVRSVFIVISVSASSYFKSVIVQFQLPVLLVGTLFSAFLRSAGQYHCTNCLWYEALVKLVKSSSNSRKVMSLSHFHRVIE